MKVKPLHDRVIVKRVEEEEKTKGGGIRICFFKDMLIFHENLNQEAWNVFWSQTKLQNVEIILTKIQFQKFLILSFKKIY